MLLSLLLITAKLIKHCTATSNLTFYCTSFYYYYIYYYDQLLALFALLHFRITQNQDTVLTADTVQTVTVTK